MLGYGHKTYIESISDYLRLLLVPLVIRPCHTWLLNRWSGLNGSHIAKAMIYSLPVFRCRFCGWFSAYQEPALRIRFDVEVPWLVNECIVAVANGRQRVAGKG
jgi:hypothetical protein